MTNFADCIDLTAARRVHAAAWEEFNNATHAYRDGEINDDEFLAAKAEYDAIGEAYDAFIDAYGY